MKMKRGIVLSVLIILLFNLSLASARDSNDSIVSGDEVPVLSDGKENIFNLKW